MKTCIFRRLGGSEEGCTVPVLGSHSSSPEARKKMIYFSVAPMKTERVSEDAGERETGRFVPFVNRRSSPPPLRSRSGWAGSWGLGGVRACHRHAPLGHYLALGLKSILSGFQGTAAAGRGNCCHFADFYRLRQPGALPVFCLLYYSVCVQPLIQGGSSVKGPEGVGLLPGLCAGRTVLGGTREGSPPQAIPLDLHPGSGIAFAGRAFRAHLGSPRCAWSHEAGDRGNCARRGCSSPGALQPVWGN